MVRNDRRTRSGSDALDRAAIDGKLLTAMAAMETKSERDLSLDVEFKTLTSEIEETIKTILDSLPDLVQVDFQRRLAEARWLLDEADRIEVIGEMRQDDSTFVLVILGVMATGLVGLLLSLLPFFEPVLNFINSRLLFLLLLIGPIVIWSIVGWSSDYLQKRIDTQTLEQVWMRWSALGLTLDLLSDCLVRGRFKRAHRRAERKRYGLTALDSSHDRIDTAENELAVQWALLSQSNASDLRTLGVLRMRLWTLRKATLDHAKLQLRTE